MLDAARFLGLFRSRGVELITGVPCSLLGDFCNQAHACGALHIAAANEGTAIAIAAGHSLASGAISLVYMQNSGLGNAMNPLASLVHYQVNGIPLVLLIGWRGEPGEEDEPQHLVQGAVTHSQLNSLGIASEVLEKNLEAASHQIKDVLTRATCESRPFAMLVQKNTFHGSNRRPTLDPRLPSRAEALREIVSSIPEDSIVVATTGFISRELNAYRLKNGGRGQLDFLMVGSMGHASQIALGLALAKPNRHVICLDGDGAMLMHLGGLATIGDVGPRNLSHVLLNNGAHESVGWMRTTAPRLGFSLLAKACGYAYAGSCRELGMISRQIAEALAMPGPHFFDVSISQSQQNELPRPVDSPLERTVRFRASIQEG